MWGQLFYVSGLLVLTHYFQLEDTIGYIYLYSLVWIVSYPLILKTTDIVLAYNLLCCSPSIMNFLRILRSDDFYHESFDRLCNFVRLVRSEVYCLFASCAGLYLLCTEYKSWPDDLLHHYPPINDFIFMVAISNWCLAMVEDISVGKEVASHIMLVPGKETQETASYVDGLMWHHVITIFAYGFSYYTHYLGGLCMFGLIFEIPIVFMNIRDIVACFDKELLYPWRYASKQLFRLYSNLVSVLFIAARFGPCLLWPLSLLIWRKNLSAIPWYAQAVYHYLGALFIYINITVLRKYVNRYILEDIVRFGALTFAELQRRKDYRVSLGEDVTDPPGTAAVDSSSDSLAMSMTTQSELMDREDSNISIVATADGIEAIGAKSVLQGRPAREKTEPDLESNKKEKEPDRSSSSTTAALRLVGMKDVGLHNRRDDLWLVIDDKVYDLTQWVDKHPGGADVLVDCAGRDASEEYRKVGHGISAQKMMKKFLVGSLIHYDQDQPQDHLQSTVSKSLEQTKRQLVYEVVHKQVLQEPYRAGCDYREFVDPMFTPVFCCFLGAMLFFSSSFKTPFRLLEGNASNAAAAAVVSEKLKQLTEFVDSHWYSSILTHLQCIMLFLLVLANVTNPTITARQLFPFRIEHYIEFTRPLQSWRNQTAALVMLGSIATDVGLLILFPTTLSLRALRVSLMLSFTIETIFRRVLKQTSESSKTIYAMWVDCLSDKISLCIVAYVLTDFFNLIVFAAQLTKHSPNSMSSLVLLIDASAVLRVLNIRMFSTHGSTVFNIGALQVCVLSVLHALLFVPSSTIVPDGISISVPNMLSYILTPSYTISYALWAVGINYMPSLVKSMSTSLFSQSITFYLGMWLWLLAPPVKAARWSALGLLFAALWFISKESTLTLKTLGTAAPRFLFVAKEMEDFFRQNVSIALFFVVLTPLTYLLGQMAPEGIGYFLFPGPILQVHEGADYGIAIQVNCPLEQQQKPEVFQCNIGYLEYDDVFETVCSTRDMIDELMEDKDSGNKGFISDLVAIFPLKQTSDITNKMKYNVREVNLSTWSSEQAATHWYRNSNAHKKILANYYGSGMNSFSSMLAQLTPHKDKPIRWEVRCFQCKKMVKGPHTSKCPYCDGDMHPIPYV